MEATRFLLAVDHRRRVASRRVGAIAADNLLAVVPGRLAAAVRPAQALRAE